MLYLILLFRSSYLEIYIGIDFILLLSIANIFWLTLIMMTWSFCGNRNLKTLLRCLATTPKAFGTKLVLMTPGSATCRTSLAFFFLWFFHFFPLQDITSIPGWKDTTYPIILHGDGGVYTKKNSSSILTISIKSMLSKNFAGNIIPCFCLPKHIRCIFFWAASLPEVKVAAQKNVPIKKVLCKGGDEWDGGEFAHSWWIVVCPHSHA